MNLYEARLLQARNKEAKEAAEAEALQKDQTIVVQSPEVLTMEDITIKDEYMLIPAIVPAPEVQLTIVPEKEVVTKPQAVPVKEVTSPKPFKKKIGEK